MKVTMWSGSRFDGGGIRLVLRLRWALLRELVRASRPLTILLVATIFIPALFGGIFIVATGTIVGAIPAAARHGIGSAAGRTIVTGLIVAVICYAVQMTLTPLRSTLSGVLGRRIEGRLRNRVMRAVLVPAGITHLEQPGLQDMVSMAQAVGIGEVRTRACVEAATDKYNGQLGGLVSAAILALFHWWAPLVLIIAWVLLRYAWTRRLRDSVQLNALQTRSLRRSSYFRDLALTGPAAKETRIFNLDTWLVDRFARTWNQAMEVIWRERRRGGPLLWVSVVALAGAQAGVLLLLGREGIRGTVSLGHLATFIQASMGVGSLASFDTDHAINSGTRPILAVTDLEREMTKPGYQLPGHTPTARMPRTGIRFENVRFRYPGSDREVFRGLDLEIPAGRSLAIVGENGAGKTTLIKLLARLYDPDGGLITVDGTDMRQLEPRQWASRVAAIFQDFVQYHLSVADNIGFGALHRAGDRDALVRAAQRVGALDMIESLPNGWDTILSREFADGTDLSGGQWQRIALARAMFAVQAGAGVLVLDEPTAHLDARAEAEFYDRFLDLTEGRTTIVISHRFSTVRRADRIVVLEHGVVVEQGTHEELVAAEGRYARMFALQAARFADVSSAAADGDE
jgi:ATP-binding cassette subfamily B protein